MTAGFISTSPFISNSTRQHWNIAALSDDTVPAVADQESIHTPARQMATSTKPMSSITNKATTTTTTTTLEVIDVSSPHAFAAPAKRIHDSQHVAQFLHSRAHHDIGVFLFQLNHALCPRIQTRNSSPSVFLLSTKPPVTPSILALQTLLSSIRQLIDEVPPDQGPRRFGNVSFRRWHTLLGERLEEFLKCGLLGDKLQLGNGGARIEVASYLLGAFGDAQRLDYGTGHELSFMAFLGCLWKLAFFEDGVQGGPIEREIVLSVIQPYLELVRKLILNYTLEPAGSHGVWGLDDHSFVPYIFGSAQLAQPVSEGEAMPTIGSVRGAPKPSDVINVGVVEDQRQQNMYFSAIGFIYDVKRGPFWEHSPMLFDISGIGDGWGKINKGMIKMYHAEVLSKFPVIQHFPFGSLFSWDSDPQLSGLAGDNGKTNTTPAANASVPAGTATQAPWAGSGAPRAQFRTSAGVHTQFVTGSSPTTTSHHRISREEYGRG